ncbi:hypothetical protein UFOVP1360_41 [uncultured Caudovirales phage]|uniref:Uncharacterized protein n=1 Tax=uncultured Caudovirales phage TaxID=2100421 RepID=A0A6J5RUI4_9CAUD|nr:hypothetical protein UFOVP1360_41 [uncultured Caudovirales phage]
MKVKYEDWKPTRKSRNIVTVANDIAAQYAAMGLTLTLRQMFYAFVSRDLLPNTHRDYKNLGNTITNARNAGLLDWDAIEDRGRNLQGLRHYATPADLIDETSEDYTMDLWNGQPLRLEAWVEKDALSSIVGQACNPWDVRYFACKGYVSASEMRAAAQRHRQYERAGIEVVVLHLGDHDPSGLDMTRDIRDRLHFYQARETTVRRIALNMDQIEAYSPPPNYAKVTDARYEGYREEYGEDSWELDALPPEALIELLNETIEEYVDLDDFNAERAEQDEGQEHLAKLARNWPEVSAFLDALPD